MVCSRSRGVLTLVIAAVLGTAALSQAEAETVGMEAQGVSPWAALHNRWKLDVRDDQNRPVSAQKIEAQLKAASAESAADNSYASRLPAARAVVRALEMLDRVRGFAASLYARLPLLPQAQAWALPLQRRGTGKRAASAAALLAFMILAVSVRRETRSCDLLRASCRSLVLRC